MALDAKAVHRKLRTLGKKEHIQRVFGAMAHEFRMHPVLLETDVEKFEKTHGAVLPADYRAFLLQVGNGGAGPGYGVFKLGEMDSGHGHARWHAKRDFVGDLAQPFPYTEAWNDLTGEPEEEGDDSDLDELEKQWKEFDERYYRPLDGAIPICHLGCAKRLWLVVTGPEAGNVWADDRADHEGLRPIRDEDHPRASFSLWYGSWLEHALAGGDGICWI